MKSIHKCDVVPQLPTGSYAELYSVAKEYTFRMLSPFLVGSTVNSAVEFKGDTSPGIPWLKLGCKDKLSAVQHPLFKDHIENKYTPVYSALDKKEFLPSADRKSVV